MKIVREFFEFQGDMFEILKVMEETSNPHIDEWKAHLGANKVLRKDGNLFYLKQVEEAQIVTEEVDTLNT